jgi:AraC-like DNA-binding protein
MLISRQPASRALVRTSAVGFSSGYCWSDRRSEWGQLLWASRGAISATINGALWTIPAGRALWIPPAAPNNVTMVGRGVLRSVYIARARCRALPKSAQLLVFAPLLRELVRRTIECDTLNAAVAIDVHVAVLLTHELALRLATPTAHIDLPLPRDPRAARAAEHILAHPGTSINELALARHASASRRTLERLFPLDTGVTLGEWHQRAALAHGMRQLASGDTVTKAAIASGYTSTSAFITAFKRILGITPGRVRKHA